MKNRIYIFDLDGTVVNSDHRYKQCCNPDGSLNIPKYYAMKGDLIKHDTLLPLANYLRRKYEQGHMVVFCTSRCITKEDTDYFDENYLPYTELLSRPEGCLDKDWDLKVKLLAKFNEGEYKNKTKVFFDDLHANVDAVIHFDLMVGVRV